MNNTKPAASRKLVGILIGFAVSLATAANAADTPPTTPEIPAGVKAAREKINGGDYGAAIPLLTAALKDKPSDADALNLMGFTLRKTGKTAEALDYYGRALALEPKHLGANEYLGELYVELGQIDKAKERLAILEAACGKNCEQTRQLTDAIGKAGKQK
jgi:tetratricopeptide (TPR) repeat protein